MAFLWLEAAMFNKRLYDRLMEIVIGCGLPLAVVVGTLKVLLDNLQHESSGDTAA